MQDRDLLSTIPQRVESAICRLQPVKYRHQRVEYGQEATRLSLRIDVGQCRARRRRCVTSVLGSKATTISSGSGRCIDLGSSRSTRTPLNRLSRSPTDLGGARFRPRAPSADLSPQEADAILRVHARFFGHQLVEAPEIRGCLFYELVSRRQPPLLAGRRDNINASTA